VRNVNLQYPKQSMGKTGEDNQYWREIRHSKQTWKGEQIVDICLNVIFTHSRKHTIQDNADRITESAMSGTKVFV